MTTTTTDSPGPRLGTVLRGARMRILGWYVLLLAGSSLVSSLLVYEVLNSRLERDADAGLSQEAEELSRLVAGRNPSTGQLFGADAAAIFDTFLRRNLPDEGEALFTLVGGRPYRGSERPPYDLLGDEAVVARWVEVSQSQWSELSTPAGPARYLAVPLQVEGQTVGVFVVARFLAAGMREIRRTVQVVAAVSAGVLLGASVLAWLVAGRVLAPVRVLSAAARRITETDFSKRIPVRGTDEIAELTRDFNAMLDRLEEAFASQRDFISDAGHELRTPITIIRGHLELMGDDPEEARETVALVTDELDRMARYVTDLSLLAKAERPDFLRPAPIDLEDFTARVFAKAKAFEPDRFRLGGCATGVAVADADRLTQAVMNLAHNAVHHAGGAGEIVLGTAAADGHAYLWVRDSGPGIPEADRARLFDRYAQGGDPSRRDGTGLGLAIVNAIARAHGGRVDLASRPGDGTTFTIVVPTEPREQDTP